MHTCMLEYLRALRRPSASLPPGVAFIQRRVIDTDVDDTLLGKWLRDTVRWIFPARETKINHQAKCNSVHAVWIKKKKKR